VKILLLGPQGCGKGTIGQMLSERIGIPLLSVGELLRSLSPESPYYKIVNEQMEKGVLVDNHLIGSILKQATDSPEYAKGYIFDGWGRQMSDLEIYDPGFDFVIVFEMSHETSIKRISGRRICEADGKTYNILTLPKEELAKCSGKLIQREDDTEEAVKKRLEIYYTQTQEVVDYFDRLGKTIHINAEPLPEIVFADLMSKLALAEN
jgi:adenylate kinase